MPPFILIFLLILVTTARHEASHAVAAWIEGADQLEIRLLPGYRADLGFLGLRFPTAADDLWPVEGGV